MVRPLTTGIDNISITDSSNNKVVGSVVFDANEAVVAGTTYNVSDSILNSGSGKTDLSLTVSGAQDAAVVITAADTVGINSLSVKNTVAQVASVDAAAYGSSLTAFNSNQSIGAVTVTNLISGATAGVIGNSALTNGASNFGWGATVTSGAVNLSNGVTAGAITTSGTLLAANTITSSGAKNTIGALELGAAVTTLTIDAQTALTTGAVTNTDAAALKTITVSGAGAVNLSATALEAAVTKIDASENTGGLTVALGSSATQVVTGGSGNDVITTGSVLTTGSVDAGDGAADVLNVGTNVAHVNTAALAAKYTNFEVLRVNGTLDASLISGIEAIQLSGATNNISKLNATQAAAITARADIGATTFALADATGKSDVLSLTMGVGTTNSAVADAGALTINGFETLNVVAKAGPTATAGANQTTTIDSFTASTLTAINLSGSAVTLGNAATTKAVTINATALTGNGESTPTGLTISGNLAKGSTVNGSGVADVFNLGTAGSTYNGGGGNDTFAAANVARLNDGSTYNTLDGGAGTNTLTIAGGDQAITLIDSNFKSMTNIQKITQVATGGTNAVSLTSGGFFDTAFSEDGVTYTVATTTGDMAVDMSTFSGDATILATTAGTTATDVNIKTGDGADKVTVTAAGFVGATGHVISVATGDGDDVITVSIDDDATLGLIGAVVINGGAGADVINIGTHLNGDAGQNVSVVVGAGDSTTAAYDVITGFQLATADLDSDNLDFAGTATLAANVTAGAVTGYSSAELTFSIATGVLSFAGTAAKDLSLTDAIAAIDSLITTTTQTVVYQDDGNSYVFNANTAGDSLVELKGVTVGSLITTNDDIANALFIS